MAGVVADAGVGLCLMHMLGDDPRTMQDDPRYDDVVDDVASFLEERLEAAVDAGVREERICLDPGIGFGKTVEHNLQLLRGLPRLARIGRPLLVGVSRKTLPHAPDAARACRRTGSRHRWRRRSRPIAVARACCACTTSPRRSTRSRSCGRSSSHVHERAHDRGAGARGARPPRRPRAREAAGPALRDRPRARAALGRGAARATCSRTRSATPTPRTSRSRSRPAQRFDLIERLAAVIADGLLARFPLAQATVRVHKPAAPIRHPFDDIVVTVTRTRA